MKFDLFCTECKAFVKTEEAEKHIDAHMMRYLASFALMPVLTKRCFETQQPKPRPQQQPQPMPQQQYQEPSIIPEQMQEQQPPSQEEYEDEYDDTEFQEPQKKGLFGRR